MKTENILKLMGAGFTADQLPKLDEYNIEDIQKLIDGQMTTEDIMNTLPVLEKVKPATPEPTPAPIPSPSSDPAPAGDPKPDGNDDPINSLAKELKDLRAAIQASNINAGSNANPKPITLADVGESFFNGTKEGDKK